VLIVMGSVLEGAAALIIFGPLLLPVAVRLGIDPLHFGVVLVIAMGIGLFAPLRRLPDRQCADRADGQADPGLSRIAAAVLVGDRLRARHQYRAAARLWLLMEHNPEKWEPVFRKDYAQTKRSGELV
jgi:hypothetical protein